MVFFITVLRMIATCLITNAHYGKVYPLEIIANGGLLGDMIFFAVSGFCLVNIKQSFGKWYIKRILRVYPPVWIITLVYTVIGVYVLNVGKIWSNFIYPTTYHFVASIMILYIVYYVVMKNPKFHENMKYIVGGAAMLWIGYYIIFYDKSYYHIDNVREPMIRVLFFFSMLIGVYYRKNHIKYQEIRIKEWMILAVLVLLYFASKILFSRYQAISQFQIVNQIIILAVVWYIFKCFAALEKRLAGLPEKIKTVVTYIANITLEIYVVQYVIIDKLSGIIFPVNWFAVTAAIVLMASALHWCCGVLVKPLEKKLGL